VFAIDPSAPNRVYAGSHDGVLRSVDAGQSWEQIPLAGGDTEVDAVAVDPLDPSVLYAAASAQVAIGQAYKSVDAGTTWTVVFARPDQHSGGSIGWKFATLPGATHTALLMTDCGFFRSFDAGATWSAASDGWPRANPGFDSVCPITGGADVATSPAAPDKAFGVLGHALAFNGGVFAYTSVPSLLPPTCSLTANPPTTSQEGGTSVLSAICSPAAASYVWSSNTGFASNATGGTVSPAGTATYTVQGINANGPGNTASVTVVAPGPRLANVSTRARVLTGADVVIGGFILGGSIPKTVIVRATGPSLAAAGIADPRPDPTLELIRGSVQVATNDDWQSAPNAAAIQATGLAPNHPKESAIMLTIDPGIAYTAVVSGVGGATGIGMVEVFEVDHPEAPLINLSTRGKVLTGEDVMIAGFVIEGDAAKTVVINVAGPSLTGFFPPETLLANPKLTLVRASDVTIIGANDDWINAPNARAIQDSGFAPNNQLEPAILMTLAPGAYTAIVEGVGGGTGRAVVGLFAVP
jgi:hypothetical protein